MGLAKDYADDFFRDLSSLGSIFGAGFILLFFLLVKNYVVVKQIITALVLGQAIAWLVRTFYFRRRPNNKQYSTFLERLDASSFPSIHAIRAGLMFVILSNYFNSLTYTLIFAAMALTVLYSRIYLKKHHFSDVVIGVVVGVITGYLSIIIV